MKSTGFELPVTDDYRRLLLNDVPLLDVRAPVEFGHGAFPTAVNRPLLDDEQRHRIGIRYKEAGQQAAIALGEQLVSGPLREARIEAWRRFTLDHPEGALYCFRGGLRSRIAQQWLAETGITLPRVRGGYRALRRFLLSELERFDRYPAPLVIGGRTGVAKTRLIRRLRRAIDLEGLANHRGSAFGRQPTPQPSQIDFENALAIGVLKLRVTAESPWVVEDEGSNIGSLALPLPLRHAMSRAPLVVLEAPFEQRVEEVLTGYIGDLLLAFERHHGPAAAPQAFAAHLLSALGRIRKRLGGLRHRRIEQQLQAALRHQFEHGDPSRHRDWIAHLLAEYYDPMYDYQLQSKRHGIVFQGDRAAVLDWLRDRGVT